MSIFLNETVLTGLATASACINSMFIYNDVYFLNMRDQYHAKTNNG